MRGSPDAAATDDAIVRATRLMRAHRFTVLSPLAEGGELRAGPLRLDVGFRELIYRDRVTRLSPIECRIVALLMTAGDTGVRASQLREALWPARQLASDPLHVHLSNVREKLTACTGRADVARFSRRHGYRLTTTGL